MQVYAHGSEATRHSIDHHGLSLGDKLNWMGVKASQWTQLGVRYDDLLPLTDQDHTKVSIICLVSFVVGHVIGADS